MARRQSCFRFMATVLCALLSLCAIGRQRQLRASEPTNEPLSLVVSDRIELPPYHELGTLVVGRLHGDACFVAAGIGSNGRELAAYRLGQRNPLWVYRSERPAEGFHLQWVDGTPPRILFGDRLIDASNGKEIHSFNQTGVNNSANLPIDVDGNPAILFGGHQFLSLADGEPPWRTRFTHRENVRLCWGYPSFVHAAGKSLFCWGSEFDLPPLDDQGAGKTSSVNAINADGTPAWQLRGIDEDMGSLPVFVASLKRNEPPKLVIGGLDLLRHNDLGHNHIYVIAPEDGALERKHPSMMSWMGLADIQGDGGLCAFGVVSHRDGGREARRARRFRCIDLTSGTDYWQEPGVPWEEQPDAIDCVGYSAPAPLAADVDGDGQLEAIIPDGNPTFYGNMGTYFADPELNLWGNSGSPPGKTHRDPWGRLYIVNRDGTVAQTLQLESYPWRILMCDVYAEGKNSLVILREAPAEGEPAVIDVYRTSAPATQTHWHLPFGNLQHWGSEH